MDDNKSKVDNKKVNKINLNMSAGDNKIKYYECNDSNCIFEILEEEKCDEKKEKNNKEKKKIHGEIVVTSILECGEHEFLQGVKINLYKINGLSPILIESEITDKEGKAIFSGVSEGCYRIIEIVDKRYFEKPKYIDWNEININDANKKQEIVVINKIKRFSTKSRRL